MKVYEIDDEEFQVALINAVYNGDKNRRYEIHFTDILYSPINAFYGKLFPTTIEDIMENREAHYENVLRWMYGRGVDIGVSSCMQGDVGTWSQKNEVKFAGGIGHLDLMFNGRAYELKTTRFPFRKDLPYSHAINQLCNYMAALRVSEGRVKVFDMIPLDERTWAVELTKKNIKDRRRRLSRKLRLLRKSLLTGDWSKLPESRKTWITAGEVDNMDFLEENPSLVKKMSRQWKREFEARQRGGK